MSCAKYKEWQAWYSEKTKKRRDFITKERVYKDFKDNTVPKPKFK